MKITELTEAEGQGPFPQSFIYIEITAPKLWINIMENILPYIVIKSYALITYGAQILSISASAYKINSFGQIFNQLNSNV